MHHLQVSPVRLAWPIFMPAGSSIGVTNFEYLYKQHMGHIKRCIPALISDTKWNWKSMVHWHLSNQKPKFFVLHVPHGQDFMYRFIRDLVSVFAIQFPFFLPFQFLNKNLSNHCYSNEWSKLAVWKITFCGVWLQIIGYSRSDLFFIAKCVLQLCDLGRRSSLFKIV